MKKANTGLLSARMMENEALIKNAVHYEKMLAEGNSPEAIIEKAKAYLKLDENTPVTGFWEDTQKEYNSKTNTFVKATSLLNSIKDMEVPSGVEDGLNAFIAILAEDMKEIYELEDEDLFEYDVEDLNTIRRIEDE